MSVIGKVFDILKIMKLLVFFVKIIAVLFIMFIVFGLIFTFAAAPDDNCILPYTPLNEEVTKTIEANNAGWTSTQVKLNAQQGLILKMSGEVSLCRGTHQNGVAQEVFITFPATESKWQPTGVYARKNALFQITLDKKYSQFPNNNCPNDINPLFARYEDANGDRVTDGSGTLLPNTGRWNDAGTSNNACFSAFGKGIFVHIGEPDGGLNTLQFDNPAFEGENDRFFELYEYIANAETPFPNDNGDIKLTSPSDGQIYLRYGEIDPTVTDTTTTQWQWPTVNSANDNRDSYDVKIISKCAAYNGQFLVGYIGDQAPAASQNEGNISLDNTSETQETDTDTDNMLFGTVLLQDYTDSMTVNLTSPHAGTLFLKIVDVEDDQNITTGDGNYFNNKGSYSVKIQTEENTNIQILDQIIQPVRTLLHGTTVNGQFYPGVPETLFKAISANGNLNLALQACMALAIALYAFKYVSTGAGGSLQELITFSVKFSIIIALISEQSWDFFYTFLLQALLHGVDSISSVIAGAFNQNFTTFNPIESFNILVTGINGVGSDAAGLGEEQASNALNSFSDDPLTVTSNSVFSTMGAVISFLTQGNTWLRVLALFTHSLFGLFMAIVLVLAIILFFMTVLRALLAYLSSLILLSILVGTAPIFLAFLLFQVTQKFTDAWLRATVYYIFYPVFILSLLGIFTLIFTSYLYSALNFSACFECLLRDQWITPYIPFTKAWCLVANFTPWVLDGNYLSNSLDDFFTIFAIYVIAQVLYKVPDFSHDMAVRLARSKAIPDPVHNNAGGAPGIAEKLGLSEKALLKTARQPYEIYRNRNEGAGLKRFIPGAGSAGRSFNFTRTAKPIKRVKEKFSSISEKLSSVSKKLKGESSNKEENEE